ncbi:helix-turn-helix transcriptional regulator [Streptomyces sp. SS7]|uniref:helix-turn-helix domain-containing protein n=1 Tax=Streptomyces sp. SS7 TaxID=3108485 RepID=UPI0030EEC7D4
MFILVSVSQLSCAVRDAGVVLGMIAQARQGERRANVGARKEPTARQVRLGHVLRDMRGEARGRDSLETVSRELGWSKAKLSRIETGWSGISESDLVTLLDTYGIENKAWRAYLLDVRRKTSARDGWEIKLRSIVHAQYADYVGMEEDASELYNAEPVLVPGLLQTHDYAAAVLAQHMPHLSESQRNARLEIREKRTGVFDRPDPLVFWGIISESVFRHALGGPDVMAAQLDHLLTMSDYPTVNIQILPESHALHAVLLQPFVVLQFPVHWEPNVVFLDGLTRTRFLEDVEDVQEYGRAFRRLNAEAPNGPESIELIEKYREHYRKG